LKIAQNTKSKSFLALQEMNPNQDEKYLEQLLTKHQDNVQEAQLEITQQKILRSGFKYPP
jgi:hypothetical protein